MARHKSKGSKRRQQGGESTAREGSGASTSQPSGEVRVSAAQQLPEAVLHGIADFVRSSHLPDKSAHV